MPLIHVEKERTISASPEQVYAVLADYRGRHREILPPDRYLDYTVEQGGQGAGTVVSYRFKSSRGERPYNMQVSEPKKGSSIAERDTRSSLVTTWTLTPSESGSATNVRVATEWQGSGNIFERLFAPMALRGVYGTVLERLQGAVLGNPAPEAG